MATLEHSNTRVSVAVASQLLVGRSRTCGLCLEEPHVSGLHAVIRWCGSHWELRDLGSRNGTWLNGARIASGEVYRLTRGATLSFGDARETWSFVDDSAPPPMVVPLDGSSPIALDRDVLGIPDDDDPEMSLLRDHRGSWHAERLDGEGLELQDGTVFEAAGRQWQFTVGDGIGPTSVLPNPQCPCPIFLRFSVSKDEEYVELRAEQEGRTIEIGSRAHNYLLLTLARFRLQDAGRDILSSARGWTYVEDLERALKTTAIRINTDVFRIRQHFAKLGLGNAVNIIERRHRAKQLRIGTESVQIVVI